MYVKENHGVDEVSSERMDLLGMADHNQLQR